MGRRGDDTDIALVLAILIVVTLLTDEREPPRRMTSQRPTALQAARPASAGIVLPWRSVEASGGPRWLGGVR
jgi:hypothetical protein